MGPLSNISIDRCNERFPVQLTVDQDSVSERVHCPNVRRPICVTKSSGKWEKSTEDLWNLLKIHERAECQSKDCNDTAAKLDAVEELNVENGSWPKTVRSEQVDEVGRSEVEVDVLQAEQSREHDATEKQPVSVVSCQDHGQDEHAVEEAVILEMDVVNDEQTGRQQD